MPQLLEKYIDESIVNSQDFTPIPIFSLRVKIDGDILLSVCYFSREAVNLNRRYLLTLVPIRLVSPQSSLFDYFGQLNSPTEVTARHSFTGWRYLGIPYVLSIKARWIKH